MALFNKNPNEVAYTGGKKHWADVIKNTGSGELLIWRQPEEDFNTNSTLIVMPGEEAIFIKGGTVEQVFENGTYRLELNRKRTPNCKFRVYWKLVKSVSRERGFRDAASCNDKSDTAA